MPGNGTEPKRTGIRTLNNFENRYPRIIKVFPYRFLNIICIEYFTYNVTYNSTCDLYYNYYSNI